MEIQLFYKKLVRSGYKKILLQKTLIKVIVLRDFKIVFMKNNIF